MKKILLFAVVLISTVSCSSTKYFYQVYSVKSENVQKEKNNLIFEDENCKIFYNLWAAKGDIGFLFYNKTDQDLYINKEDCFLIINGLANNYFQNRVYTYSKGTSVSKGASTSQETSIGANESVGVSQSVTGINVSNLLQTNSIGAGASNMTQYTSGSAKSIGSSFSSGFAVSINEEKVVCIPQKSGKIIKEFSIKSTTYKNCDLIREPKTTSNLTFSKDNSPLVFSNRISYCKDNCINQTIKSH